MTTKRLSHWCAFRGMGQWDCDDAPCENGAAFSVGGVDRVEVCVRHVGYAAAILLHHGAVTVERVDV